VDRKEAERESGGRIWKRNRGRKQSSEIKTAIEKNKEDRRCTWRHKKKKNG
jgi:hypothetical protein